MPLDTQLLVSLIARYTKQGDLNIPESVLTYPKEFNLVSGSDVDEADKVFQDKRTLNASADEELDLAGVLADAFGDLLTFDSVKVLLIYADPANVNDVVVGGAAANGFASMFGDATDTVKVKPGGLLLLIAREAAGYEVTAGTGDLLKIANGGAGTPVTYDIVVIGD